LASEDTLSMLKINLILIESDPLKTYASAENHLKDMQSCYHYSMKFQTHCLIKTFLK